MHETAWCGDRRRSSLYAWYLRAKESLHRFFVQHGVLSWGTSPPDPADDLADGEDYYDVFERNSLTGTNHIKSVEMACGLLTIAFSTGPKFLFKEIEQSGGTSINLG
jgi:hypothetical protein